MSESVRFEEVLNLILFKTCNPLKKPRAKKKKKKSKLTHAHTLQNTHKHTHTQVTTASKVSHTVYACPQILMSL